MYDASRPKGKYDLGIFEKQDIDIICSGNHELYKRASVEFEYNTTVPSFKDNYLASNLDIIDAETGEQKPLAPRFKKFTTKNQGIRILAMGFLFDFANGADNVVVQDVEKTIKEQWFQGAIRDRDVDLFLVTGHVPLHSPEFEAVFKAIREQQWDTPIQFFGGHTHIRDYAKYDKKSYALESGRYLETIGFMSIDGLNTGGKKIKQSLLSAVSSLFTSVPASLKASGTPTYARRYIDNNLFSFHHHAGLNASAFATQRGLNVSADIHSARKKLELDYTYGCVPQTYWTNRAPFPSDTSVFSLVQDHILPEKVSQEDRMDVPRIILTNTGAIRFDIFEGKFTIDTMYTVSPFTSGFRFVKDVPWKVAQLLLKILNQDVPQLWPVELATEMRSLTPVSMNKQPSTNDQHSAGAQQQLFNSQFPKQRPLMHSADDDDDENLTPGYTTHDAAGSDGDDTVHSSIKFYKVPNCIQSQINFPQKKEGEVSTNDDGPETVDVVYNEFLEPYILLALKFLGTDYDQESTESYADGKTMTALLGEWVSENWKCDDGDE